MAAGDDDNDENVALFYLGRVLLGNLALALVVLTVFIDRRFGHWQSNAADTQVSGVNGEGRKRGRLGSPERDVDVLKVRKWCMPLHENFRLSVVR